MSNMILKIKYLKQGNKYGYKVYDVIHKKYRSNKLFKRLEEAEKQLYAIEQAELLAQKEILKHKYRAMKEKQRAEKNKQ